VQLCANGTANSIILWGKRDKLDKEQQIAFEIITATYVLTFVNNAIGDHRDFDLTLIPNLKTLARKFRKDETGEVVEYNKPLCLFVTGPAGSGKCK